MAKDKKHVTASLTAEAALAFPVFFFAVVALCSLFSFIEAKMTVRRAMVETARSVSAYGDLLVRADCDPPQLIGYLSDAIAVRALLEDKLENRELLNRTVEGGTAGILCTGSELLTGDDCIYIVCTYLFKPPVAILGLGRKAVRQELKYRYFTGYKVPSALEEVGSEEETEDETIVYVADRSEVYHLTLTCPALNLHVRSISKDDVSSARNESGGRYYPCEKCAKGECPDILYITTDGDRYHYKFGCSGLKRTVSEVRISEIKDIRLCKRCGKVK